MIGQSQSGTGKTAAFVLTMLSRIDFSKDKPQALCLAPSRELARQIMSVIGTMGKFTPVQTEYAIKDHLPRDATKVTAHIIVGTPGTMMDLIRRKVIDVSEVKVFVLDEADNMLNEDGLGDKTLRIKKCESLYMSDGCACSATLHPAASFREEEERRSSCSRPRSQTTSASTRTTLRQTRTRSS